MRVDKTHNVKQMGVEDNKLYCRTTFYDDNSLEQNNKIRGSGHLDNMKLDLHDNEDVRAIVSCPSFEQWSLFKKKYRDIYNLVKSTDEAQRMQGVLGIKLIHPEWVIMERL